MYWGEFTVSAARAVPGNSQGTGAFGSAGVTIGSKTRKIAKPTSIRTRSFAGRHQRDAPLGLSTMASEIAQTKAK
jgi:hypothetical protein